jgi:glycosyltransferase involved in cell wall biosynthesis
MISIYIPSHNYGQYLVDAIESVIKQTFQNWELFIIDDASSDNTQKIGIEYAKKFKNKIHFHRNEINQGLQKIANEVIKKANGDFLLRLDGDDYLDESALAVLFHKMHSDPKCNLVYGDFYYIDVKGNVIGKENRQLRGKDTQKAEIFAPHGACSLIRMKHIKKVGGYDISINAQDGWDIWLKLKKLGTCKKVDWPLFYYRQHDLSLSRDREKVINARNEIIDQQLQSTNLLINKKGICVLAIKNSFPKLRVNTNLSGEDLVIKAIEQALVVDTFEQIIISIECHDIKRKIEKLVLKYNTNRIRIHLRKKKYRKNAHVPLMEILQGVDEYVTNDLSLTADFYVYLGLTASNRNSEHINRAIKIYKEFKFSYVVSVLEERDPVFKFGNGSLELLNPGRFSHLEYHDEKLMKFNGSIVLASKEELIKGRFLNGKIGFLEMSLNESFLAT